MLSTLALIIGLATVARFSNPKNDGGYISFDTASDCGDSDGGDACGN